MAVDVTGLPSSTRSETAGDAERRAPIASAARERGENVRLARPGEPPDTRGRDEQRPGMSDRATFGLVIGSGVLAAVLNLTPWLPYALPVVLAVPTLIAAERWSPRTVSL